MTAATPGQRHVGVQVRGQTVDAVTVLGAGGHGREIIAFLLTTRPLAPTIRVLDDSSPDPARLQRLGLELGGSLSRLADDPGAFLIGIGTADARRSVAERASGWGGRPASYVHPDAIVADDAELGDGVVIFPRSTVTTNVTIGDHSHLNVGCTVQHDSTVGCFVQMSPGVLVNGDCHVGDGVFLGSGAVVTRGVTIGAGAIIGAGAVVLRDVPASTRVLGLPARTG